MPFTDHRSVRIVLGALAVYMFWSAAAPPFGVLGPAPLVRIILAIVAGVLVGAVFLRPSRPVALESASAAVSLPSSRADRTPASRARRWRSSGVEQAIMARRGGTRRGSADTSTARGNPHSVIVLCDGTLAGDNACRLAERFSKQSGATVHAFSLLPIASFGRTSLTSEVGPVEAFLDRVEAQLRRTTSALATWPLTLVVHDLEGELQRACVSFGIDTIVAPATLCTGPTNVLGAAAAAISAVSHMGSGSPPVLCVVGADGEPSVPPMPASRRSDARTLAPLASGEPTRRVT